MLEAALCFFMFIHDIVNIMRVNPQYTVFFAVTVTFLFMDISHIVPYGVKVYSRWVKMWQYDLTNKIASRNWLYQVKLTVWWLQIASVSICSPVTKTYQTRHQKVFEYPMGSAKDTKQDDLVDMEEFAEWLTNVNATITVGLLASKLKRPWAVYSYLFTWRSSVSCCWNLGIW